MKTFKQWKTKLVALLASTAVLCSGACLFACDPNTPETPETPGETPIELPELPLTATEKLEKGLDRLLAADGTSGAVALELDVNGEKTDYAYSYVKSGYRVEATGDGRYIIDLDSGYFYSIDDNATTAEQVFDAGRLGYIVEAIKSDIPGALDKTDIDDYVSLTDDGSVRYFVDYKKDVNSALKTLCNYYADGSLYQLIDAVLAEDGKTLKSTLDGLATTVKISRDSSASFIEIAINVYLIKYNTSLKQIFTSYGVTEEQYEAVKTRTVGEFAEGVIHLYDEAEQLIADFVTDGAENIDVEKLVQHVFDVLFVDEMDTTNVIEDIDEFVATITDWLTITKVKTVVGLISDRIGDGELATAIENNVTFNALQFETVIKFDGEDSIVEIAFEAKVAYGYTVDGTAQKYSYAASGALTVDYEQAQAISLPSGATVESLSVRVLANKDGDTTARFETGEFGGVLNITAFTVDGEPVLLDVEHNTVTFDAETHTLTFEKLIASKLHNAEHNVQVEITGTLGDAPVEITYVIPADYTLESLLDF